MLQNKPELSNFITLAYISSDKIIDIHFYWWQYENSKGLAIIQDFTAHWAIKNKQIMNVCKFISVRMHDALINDSGT